MSEVIEYVVVKRTTTAEVWLPRSDYILPMADENDGTVVQQMTDEEIRQHEADKSGVDAWNALEEIVSVTEESRIKHTVEVSFSVGSPEQSGTWS